MQFQKISILTQRKVIGNSKGEGGWGGGSQKPQLLKESMNFQGGGGGGGGGKTTKKLLGGGGGRGGGGCGSITSKKLLWQGYGHILQCTCTCTSKIKTKDFHMIISILTSHVSVCLLVLRRLISHEGSFRDIISMGVAHFIGVVIVT